MSTMSIFLRHFDGELDYCHVLVTDETLPGKFGKMVNRTTKPYGGSLLQILQAAYDHHRVRLASIGISATPVDSVIVCVEQTGRIFFIKDFNKHKILY